MIQQSPLREKTLRSYLLEALSDLSPLDFDTIRTQIEIRDKLARLLPRIPVFQVSVESLARKQRVVATVESAEWGKGWACFVLIGDLDIKVGINYDNDERFTLPEFSRRNLVLDSRPFEAGLVTVLEAVIEANNASSRESTMPNIKALVEKRMS